MCGKLQELKKDLLAVRGYGSEYDCGVYGGESRKTKAGKAF